MKSVLICLRETQQTMSSTERNISQYIRDNPSEASMLTIRQMAKKTFASPSSIVRMCRLAGFSGYKDFHQALLLELATLGNDLSHQEKEIQANDSVETIIDQITNKNMQSLEDTRRLLDVGEVSKSARLLADSRNILLFAMGASLCVARDTYMKFLRLNKPCVFNDDWHLQLLQARNSSPSDVGLAITYSGNTKEVVACMEALKANGTPCIVITRYSSSPAVKLADHCLYIAANESLFRNGAMSSRISQLNVIDILYTIFANMEYDHSMQQLARTHIYKGKL